MTVGWAPGGYSGIQQSGATPSWAPSSKNFICSMWDTNTDNHGNAEGGTPSYSYVDELNEEADVGGQVGVTNRNFGGEGTGQQITIDYPWAIGDTTTAFIRGTRKDADTNEWCVESGLAPPGKEEVFLARFCRKSPVHSNLPGRKFDEETEANPNKPIDLTFHGRRMEFQHTRSSIIRNPGAAKCYELGLAEKGHPLYW